MTDRLIVDVSDDTCVEDRLARLDAVDELRQRRADIRREEQAAEQERKAA